VNHDSIELIEPGLLLVSAPRPLCCSVGLPPALQERPGDLHQAGHPRGMGQQEVAGQIGPERMSQQNGPVVSPRVEQRRQVANVAGDRVLPLPGRSAGAALVVAVDQAQVVDDAGDRREIVGDSWTAVHHDHGKSLRDSRARRPRPQPCAIVHLDHGRECHAMPSCPPSSGSAAIRTPNHLYHP
jgi:hypothetical protein